MNGYRILIGALCCAALPAIAQSAPIPPPLTPGQIAEKRKAANEEALLQGSTKLPGAIMDGAVMLQQRVDKSGVGKMIDATGTGKSIISRTVSGAKILEGFAQDGAAGLEREGVQFILDEGVGLATEALVKARTLKAVASGVAIGTATGVAGLSFEAGSLFGTWARNSPDLGKSIGLRGTIGDEVDNGYFYIAPDWLKEAASGVKQVDIDDPDVLKQMSEASERNRRMRTFESIQRENAEQQRQIDASRVVMSGELSPSPAAAPSSYDPTAALTMQAILGAAQANQAARQSMPAIDADASGGSCKKLDPKTGCHVGHDEKAHPGGCKKC